MKKDFYYAALDLTLSLIEGNTDILKCLTDNEFQVLQNNLWMTISGFLTARACYLKDTVEALERIKSVGKKDSDIAKGG